MRLLPLLILALALAAPAAAPAVAAAPAASPLTAPAALAESPFTASVELYDSARGTLPSAQSFAFVTGPPLFAAATQVFSDGVTLLDSMPNRSESAGYFPQDGIVPALDRTLGYTVSVTVQLLQEEHDGSDRNPGQDDIDDRAGFSLIVLGSDLRGVEIGFWQDRVWAQADSPIFTQAEGAAYDTGAALARYDLRVQGDAYTLLADGSPILSGPLRDYTAFVPGQFQVDPYETPNLVFLGDDTGSARAQVRIAAVSLELARQWVAVPVALGG